MGSFFEAKSENTAYKTILWAGILFGITLRLIHYFSNQSLWVDEAALASSILSRSYMGLLENLDYHQVAPVAFLFIERFFVSILGSSEFALRLFPLICGVASVFLFCQLCKRTTDRLATCVGVLFFSASTFLVYYSAELKQYSTDVFAATACCLFLDYFVKQKITFRMILGMTIASVFFVFLSQVSVFVLFGISAGLFVHVVKQSNRSKFSAFLIFCTGWGIAFILNYYFFLSRYEASDGLIPFWLQKEAFLRIDSVSGFVLWFPKALLRMLSNPCGFSNQALVLPFLILGVYRFAKDNVELMTAFAFIFISIISASAFKLFPFSERVILFTVPITFLIFAYGISQMIKPIWPYSKLIVVTMLFILLWSPFLKGFKMAANPVAREDVKPLLAYVQANAQHGDVLYLYPALRKTYAYYQDRYDFSRLDNVILGEREKNRDDYVNQLCDFEENRRVWFLFTHVKAGPDYDDRQLFLMNLNQKGKRVDQQKAHWAWLYLYEFEEVK